MVELILASSSVYRAALLRRLNVTFINESPNINENPIGDEQPDVLATRLSVTKTMTVASKYPHATVIGSDQVCALGQQIFGKPHTKERAIEQLMSFSDSCIEFYTGLCVQGPAGRYTHLDVTQVQFRTITLAEVERYIETESPLDCAGAFKVEGLGISLFKSIKSNDPTALTGLPLIKLAEFLRKSGLMIP